MEVHFILLSSFFMADQNVYLKPPVLLPIIAAVIVGGAFITGKFIETRDTVKAQIAVSGEGKAFVTPDIAQVSFGIQTGRQPTAAAAMKKLQDGMDKIYAAVQKAGVDKKDIGTESFWLNPAYDWTEANGQVLRGFEASQSFRVKVRNIDKSSDVLAAATAAGANQAGNIDFTVDEPEAKQAEARTEAIKEAQEKAQALAASLGMRLGRLVGFSEGGVGTPSVMMMRAEGMGGGGDMAAANTPLPPGEQEVRVSVSLTYELE